MRLESRKEETRDSSLTTAALAHVDDRSDTEREIDRISSPPDRPPADDESQPTLVAGTEAREKSEAPVRDRADVWGTADRNSRADANRIDASRTTTAVSGNGAQDDEKASPLFSEAESKDFFARWDALQVGFIDEPRHAVEQADNLVAGAMKRLAEIFSEERARLEGQWDRGDNVSTEDLRVAMRRYRSFFRRLLAV